MKKMWKRLSAIAMMVVLVLTMALPAMAAPTAISGSAPAATDTKEVTIEGLAKGDEVTFIQIVDATYDASGFTGYVINDKHKSDHTLTSTDNNGTEKVTYPSAADITALANDKDNIKFSTVAASTETATVADGATSVTKALGAGEWMVLVKSADLDTIYNPMVVSVYYTDNGSKIDGGSVNAGSNYKLDTDADPAYAKKSTSTNTKEIKENTDHDVQNPKGDDLSVGDTVSFEIKTVIPSYSEDYETVTFEISDTMDAGLTLQHEGDAWYTIKLNGVAISKKEGETDQYNVTDITDQGFTVAFDSDYVKSLSGKSDGERTVTVEYSAKLNDNAQMNLDANVNTSKVKYSNNPADSTSFKEKEDHTYQYTFEIDGKITGRTGKGTEEFNRKGHELIKVDENGAPTSTTIWGDWEKDDSKSSYMESEVTTGLSGARFELTEVLNAKDEAVASPKTYSATTDDNGYFVDGFKGLDAGTYRLKETAAPEGYSLNAQEYTVKISADYNEDGTLKSYSIDIWEGTSNEKPTGSTKITNTTYTVSSYTSDAGTTTKYVEAISSGENPTFIKNTKLNELPSTGGMGTYLFTFIGVALMVFGVVAYRRNSVAK